MPLVAPTDNVAAAYDRMPDAVRALALGLRALVFQVADSHGLPAPEETLKWGEPSYLPGRGGTTVRIGPDSVRDGCKLLVNCQTTLVEEWRQRFEGRLHFEGNRAVLLSPSEPVDRDAVAACIADALTYHARKTVRHG